MTSTAPLLQRVLAVEEPEDENSRRILDAAREQIQQFGLRRLTMEDVATAAGLGRATIYRRFGSKDDLVEAVMLRELSRFLTEVDDSVSELPTLEEQLVEGFVATLRAARENPVLGQLLRLDQDVALPFLTVKAAPGIAVGREFLAHRIRTAQAEGLAPDFDPRPVAELLVRLCQSLLLTPEGLIPSGDDAAARRFARTYLTPIVTRPHGFAPAEEPS